MYLGLKASLLLFAGYAILAGALALGIDAWIRSVEETTGRETVLLLAQEKAALFSDETVAALTTNDKAALARVRIRLQALVGHSDVVPALAVVDSQGRVKAGEPAGSSTAPKPEDIFKGKLEPRFEALGPASFFQGASYEVYLPLEQGGHLVGYVRASVRGEGVAGFYRRTRRELLWIGLLGLIAAGFLGFVLQYEIGRRAASITRTLDESAPRPSLLRGGDELSRTLAAATRVREALNEARRESGRMHYGFSALAQVMKVGVVLVRGDGSVEFANPRARELISVESESGLGELWGKEALKATLGALAPGSAKMVEFPVRDGRRTFRVELYRLGDQDAALLLMNDPRILETLETDVRLASQLEGLARTYRTVAHELRAPLSAVMINLDLLRESLVDSEQGDEVAKQRQNRYVTILAEEFARLNRSLAELLTQTSPPNEPQRPFDVFRTLRDLGTLLAPQARRQGVALTLSVPEKELTLVGYRDRLKQALLNIAVNALEAMPGGGRMGIEAVADKRRVKVEVSDTGDGIAPELLPRIYESDFTTKGGGSGIGLYVARALVELHGGRIQVESQVGTGTRVSIELPLVEGT